MSVDWDATVLRPCHDQAFGEAATFTPAGGQAMAITGVFFNGYTSTVALLDGSVDVTTVKPVLAVRESQFSGRQPQQGDMIVVASNGGTYYIKDVQPDGVGELRLVLQKAGLP